MALSFLMVLLSSLLQLGLLAMLIAAAMRMRASGLGLEASGVRRFFQYLLLFVLVVLAAVGMSLLLSPLFGGSEFDRPTAFSFTIIGLPLAVVLGWLTFRSHRRDPVEARSEWFVIYVTFAALTALLVGGFTSINTLTMLLSAGALGEGHLAWAIVWIVVWAIHWYAASRLPIPVRNTPHLLMGSIVGLGTVAAGLVLTIGESLRLILHPVTWLPSTAPLSGGVALLVVGAAIWIRYWLTAAARLRRGLLWLAYVLLAGTGGGLVLALVGASLALWKVLVWFLGSRGGASSLDHFAGVWVQLACLVSGLLVWRYHHVLLTDQDRIRTGSRRVYEYVMAGIGLGAVAVGIGLVVSSAAQLAVPQFVGEDQAINVLLAGVTLLVVGVPVWARFWRRISRAVAADPVVELAALTRRIYLVLVLGVAAIVAIVALVAVAFRFFQDLTSSGVSAGTLAALGAGLGWLVGALAVIVYHVAVLRQDRMLRPHAPVAEPTATDDLAPLPASPRVASITLIGRPDPVIALALGRATGASVESWARLDSEVTPWHEPTLLALVSGHPGQDLLVLAEGDHYRAISVARPPSARKWPVGPASAPGDEVPQRPTDRG